MTEQPQDPPTGAPPTGDGPPRDEVLEPTEQPAAGGTDEGEPAQGEGAPDSY